MVDSIFSCFNVGLFGFGLRVDQHGLSAGEAFPSGNGAVDVAGLIFDEAGGAIDALGGYQRAAGAAEEIDDDVAGRGHIE